MDTLFLGILCVVIVGYVIYFHHRYGEKGISLKEYLKYDGIV